MLRTKLIKQHHALSAVGHTGTAKIYEVLSHNYFWVNMCNIVARFIQNCHTCSCAKASHHKPLELLHPLKVPSNAWEEISMDFVTSFPETQSGHNAILVNIDPLTQMRHFAPSSSKY